MVWFWRITIYLYTRWTHTLLGNMVAIIGWNPEGGKCSFSLLFLNLLSKTCLRPQVCVDTSNSCESNMKGTELNHVLPFLSPIEPQRAANLMDVNSACKQASGQLIVITLLDWTSFLGWRQPAHTCPPQWVQGSEMILNIALQMQLGWMQSQEKLGD